jgi:hypothetical protein
VSLSRQLRTCCTGSRLFAARIQTSVAAFLAVRLKVLEGKDAKLNGLEAGRDRFGT